MQATAAPAITKRIQYSALDHDYAAYVSIDGEPEQYIGSRKTQGEADRLCDEYAYNFYSDANTPEVAARIAVEGFKPTSSEAEPTRPACQGAHHAQRCPAIGALLLADILEIPSQARAGVLWAV